jgi:hypothetical protein
MATSSVQLEKPVLESPRQAHAADEAVDLASLAAKTSQPARLQFRPMKLRGGGMTASEIIIAERG